MYSNVSKKFIFGFVVLATILGCLLFTTSNASAASRIETYDDVFIRGYENTYEKEFDISPGHLAIYMKIDLKSYGKFSDGDSIKFRLYRKDAVTQQYTYADGFTMYGDGKECNYFYYNKLKSGHYKLVLQKNHVYTIKGKVVNYFYNTYLTSADVSKSTTINMYSRKKLPIRFKSSSTKLPGMVIKSSNPKVLKIYNDGKYYFYGEGLKAGKSTVTVTLLNGKQYKINVTVKFVPQEPDFTAYLYNYNTRENHFTLRVENFRSKPITFYSSGAYSMDVDYKFYDRKLRLRNGSYYTVPGKSVRYVKYKVNGPLTWPNYHDHTVRCYFKYDTKKYLGSFWDDGSVYKDGKYWYNTFY